MKANCMQIQSTNPWILMKATVKREWESVFREIMACRKGEEGTPWFDLICRINLRERKLMEEYLWVFKYLHPAIYDIREWNDRVLVEIGWELKNSIIVWFDDPRDREVERFLGTFCAYVAYAEMTEPCFLGPHGVTMKGMSTGEGVEHQRKGTSLKLNWTKDIAFLSLSDFRKRVYVKIRMQSNKGDGLSRIFGQETTSAENLCDRKMLLISWLCLQSGLAGWSTSMQINEKRCHFEVEKCNNTEVVFSYLNDPETESGLDRIFEWVRENNKGIEIRKYTYE